MAFMDHNREVNGAPRPSATASQEESEQRSQERLSTNPTDFGTGQKRTFQPNLETEEAINRRHYRGGLDEGEWPDYSRSVPYGPSMGGGEDDL